MRQTNAEREKLGLTPLVANSKLTQAALAKGQDMLAQHYWAHVSPTGTQPWTFMKNSGYVYQLAGENLARDFANTPDMVRAWMNSPTHRANIVNGRYREIGVAVLEGELEGQETTLVVQMFGTPLSSSYQSEDNLTVANKAEENLALSNEPEVLATFSLPSPPLSLPALFSPLQITKAFFLAVIMILSSTLLYDTIVIGHRGAMRLVGKNLAHLFLFFAIAFLLIFFKGGIVG